MTKRLRLACIAVLIGLAGVPAGAQEREVPYWASIRVDEVNMRVGPGGSYRVAWVYRRKQLPVKVVRLMQGWRLIEDPDGDRGWMLGRFLTLDRGAIVTGEGLADMREQAELMEQQAERFYRAAAQRTPDADTRALLDQLAAAESAHCRTTICHRFGPILPVRRSRRAA